MSGVRSVLILSWVFLLFSFCSAHEGKPEVCPFSAGSIHHHDHDHHHDGCNHDHNSHPQVRKLPEELAEEEDLAMEDLEKRNFRHHHNHGISEFSTLGLWVQAMGCSLLVSMASLICLVLLPLFVFQGKPSKQLVDCLAVFGAGAMLGDAFLHQLPHAFGGGHSHGHEHVHSHDDHHRKEGSHAHSLKDLSIGLSVLGGILVFLLVEKMVRYIEDASGKSGHAHHHHYQINDKKHDDSHVLKSDLDDKHSKTSKRKLSPISQNSSSAKVEEEKPSSLVFGYLNLFSDGVHNFTDGMALGSAFLLHGSVGGWSTTLFLLAHELPQEVGDFGILVRSGFSVSKALLFNFLSALVALAGTALALLLGKDPGHSTLIEGFTAGGFIYISVAGVLPEMNSGSPGIKSSILHIISFIFGIVIALCISLVE